MAANGMVDGPESPLLEDTVARSRRLQRPSGQTLHSGGWSSSYFIIGKHGKMIYFLAQFSVDSLMGSKRGCISAGTEVAERSAYFGIEANLVNYFDWATTTVPRPWLPRT
ncbi:hypothetical protein CK203_031525 [Vitis vinifera]|uniref:Uncharacterized protein n=1 Tax=Vitis vinifera TaxID=29760 RepID=A0A438IFW8_VITVI|nr:hypothetical protein CK203_031525 [Vitis vinifera]